MSTSNPGTKGADSRPVINPPERLGKMPQITVLFWVITILTAGMGQAIFDWLIVRGIADPGMVVVILGSELALFLITLALQLAVRRFVAPVYWLAVIGVSVFGTLLADVAHFLIGLPLWATPILFALVVAIVFLFWYRAERTLSIHSIRTRRREASYWVTVLFIFALGTSIVDLVTTVWNISGLASGVVFLVLFLAAASQSLRLQRATVFLFWASYLLTRPASGSFSDWLTNELGLGAGLVALVASVLIVVLVGYLTVTDRRNGKLPRDPSAAIARP